MTALLPKIKSTCQALVSSKLDYCERYWLESDCLLVFYPLSMRRYALGGGKFFSLNLEIADPPKNCEKPIRLPEVPKNEKCLDFARAEVARYNQHCYWRYLMRKSDSKCLPNYEWSDCNMKMGLHFIEWAKHCKFAVTEFQWSIGFEECSDPSLKETPNRELVTKIAEAAKHFCEADSNARGKGDECEA